MIEHPEEVLVVIVGAGASFDCLQDPGPTGPLSTPAGLMGSGMERGVRCGPH